MTIQYREPVIAESQDGSGIGIARWGGAILLRDIQFDELVWMELVRIFYAWVGSLNLADQRLPLRERQRAVLTFNDCIQ